MIEIEYMYIYILWDMIYFNNNTVRRSITCTITIQFTIKNKPKSTVNSIKYQQNVSGFHNSTLPCITFAFGVQILILIAYLVPSKYGTIATIEESSVRSIAGTAIDWIGRVPHPLPRTWANHDQHYRPSV